jgi:hypothetical protein
MDKTRKTSKRRPRRSFTPAFKAEAVRLCRIGASIAVHPHDFLKRQNSRVARPSCPAVLRPTESLNQSALALARSGDRTVA